MSSLGAGICLLLLSGVPGLGLGLSLGFEIGDDAFLGPAGDSGELTESAEVSAGLQAEGSESIRDDHSLLLIIGERNTLEDLQLAESGGASWQLVGEHASEGLPENTGGSFPVLGSAAWVGVDALLHNVLSNDVVSLERARLEDLFASDDGDALTAEQFLSDDTGKTALKVTSSVND